MGVPQFKTAEKALLYYRSKQYSEEYIDVRLLMIFSVKEIRAARKKIQQSANELISVREKIKKGTVFSFMNPYNMKISTYTCLRDNVCKKEDCRDKNQIGKEIRISELFRNGGRVTIDKTIKL